MKYKFPNDPDIDPVREGFPELRICAAFDDLAYLAKPGSGKGFIVNPNDGDVLVLNSIEPALEIQRTFWARNKCVSVVEGPR